MSRQTIRKVVLSISLLLFPLTLYYFSPILIIQGAAKGIVTGSFLVFGAMFLVSIFYGRLFCSWICPGAALQEACFRLNSKPARGGRYSLIKYGIWIIWLSVLLFFSLASNCFLSFY